MYKQVDTVKEAVLYNGSKFNPIATLKSEYGELCHINIDDGCYVLALEIHNDARYNGRCKWTTHVFPEAFEVLKTLPDLRIK